MSVEIEVVERIIVESDTPDVLEVTESAFDIIEQTTTLVTEGEPAIEIINDANQIVIADDPISIIEVGPQGPQGAPAEDDLVFAKRVDFVGTTVIYRGEANPGTVESAASWRVRRITFTGAEEDVTEEWADGNAQFDNIWDDRLTLSYS